MSRSSEAKDKKLVDMVCQDCNTIFQITKGVVRKRPKDYHFRCKKCRKIQKSKLMSERYQNLSEEEKKISIKRFSDAGIAARKKKPKIIDSTAKVRYKCVDCGIDIEISYATHRKCVRNNTHPRCKECDYKLRGRKSSERYQNLSDKEKQTHSKNCSIRAKRRYESLPEDSKKLIKDNMRNVRNDYFTNNASEEELEEIKELRRIGLNNYFNNLTSKQKKKRSETSRQNIQKALVVSTSPEFRERQSIRATNQWNSKTPEEQLSSMQAIWDGNKRWRENLSLEEIEYRNNQLVQERQKWWSSLTFEERQEWRNACIRGYDEYLDNLNIVPNKNESNFINELNKYHLQYIWQYKNKIEHPDFYKLFPFNPVTGGNVEWEHWWDFIIYTKQGNILVDVDGSIHKHGRPDTIKENRMRYPSMNGTEFNDNQRPYQTDGLDAYIIECYNNKLDNDTKVLHIKNNKSIEESNEYTSFKEFMNMIQLMNYSDKELREIL